MCDNYINILTDNNVKKFDFDTQLNEFIDCKINDYLLELQENNFKINEWRKLELITAYKNKALMYEDVPLYIKELHNLPARDEGIDVVKIVDGKITKVFQCKHYNGYVSNKILKHFYQFQNEKYNLNDVEFILVGSSNTLFKQDLIQIKYNINENFGIPKKIEGSNKQPELRFYQKEAIDKIQFAYDNDVSEINIKIPCGCGKTMLMYHFGMTNYKILILVPKINIAEQIKTYFNKILNKKININWKNSHKDNQSNVTISVYNSVGTLVYNEYDMVFIDEAHHIIKSEIYKQSMFENGFEEEFDPNNQTYIDLISNAINTKLRINMSATIDIKTEYDYEFEFHRAIEEGYLTDYEINVLYMNKSFNIDTEIINEDTQKRLQQLVTVIKTNKEYKHIILYCSRIKIAELCKKVLSSNGIISSVITSETSKTTRNNAIEDFKNGLTKVICSVNCLNEGTDLPIADTAIFLNDRNAEINIIQCVGRILRLHKYKNKARVVIFDTNEEDGNKKGDYYLRALDKYDNYFRKYLTRRLNVYNYTGNKNYEFGYNLKKRYFDKIIKFRITDEQKKMYCQEFYDKYHRLPTRKETINNWNIGIFISGLKVYNSPIKIEIEKIFNTTIEANPLSFDDKCEKCRKFEAIYHRPPKSNEIFDGWNIGTFIDGVKYKESEEELKKLNAIFKGKIKTNKHCNNKRVLELSKRYKNEFNRIPKYDDKYEYVKLGEIICKIMTSNYRPEIKNQIIEIFGNEITIRRKRNLITFERKKELVLEFYHKYGRLPRENEDYKNFDLGGYINRLKQGQMENERKEIEKLLGIELKANKITYERNDSSFEENIEKCKVFYKQTKRLPKSNDEDTKLADFNIYDFINNVRRSKNEEHIKIIESIFECELKEIIPRTTAEEKLEIISKFLSEHGSFDNITNENKIYLGLNMKTEYEELRRLRSDTYKFIKSELLKRFPGLNIPEQKHVGNVDHQRMLDLIDEYLTKNSKLNGKTTYTVNGKVEKIGNFCANVMRLDRPNEYKDVRPVLMEIFEQHNFTWPTRGPRVPQTDDEIFELFKACIDTHGSFPKSTTPGRSEELNKIGSKWKSLTQPNCREKNKELINKILAYEQQVKNESK